MNISPIKMYDGISYQQINNTNVANTKENYSDAKNNNNTSFKSKGNWFDRLFGQKYITHLYKQDWFNNLAQKLENSKLPGNMTANMATFGSLLTSGTYIARTINNKDFDPDKRRTLAINQVLSFIVPTVCAYTVNSMLKDWVDRKKKEYSATYNRRANLGLETKQMSQKEFDEFMAKKGKRLLSVNILATLVTFTLIYRFITPVLITPIANKIGEWVNNKNKKNQEQEPVAETNTKPLINEDTKRVSA